MNKWITLATVIASCSVIALVGSNAHAAGDAEHEGVVAMPVTGDAAAGKDKAQVCGACHGPDGMAIQAEYPNLAGQNASYTAKQLTEFRDGIRNNPIMAPQAGNLSDTDILDIAEFYASLPKMQGVSEEADLVAGESIYRGGISSAEIASCIGCHGPAGLGNPSAGYPAISGQNAAYTALQLKAFRSGERNNDPNQMMGLLAHRLSDAEINAVANYVAGLHSSN